MREIKNKEYYNKDLKKRYLEEKEKTLSYPIYYIDVQFRNAATTEIELDKDLSNWSKYEIVEYYKLFNTSSVEVLQCLTSIFSQYTQFCLENSLVKDNQNHYLEITLDLMNNCVNKSIFNKKIVSRETVLQWVDELPNPRDQFILLSLFEFGKSQDFKDIVYAKPEHCNQTDKTLKLSDRTVNISDKLISIIDQCIERQVYVGMTGKGEKQVPLADYGYIVKNYPNQNIDISDFQKGRNIYMACQRMFAYLGVDKWMAAHAVAESGKIHMVQERAKQLNITPMQYVLSHHIEEVEVQFGCNITKSIFCKKYEEYLA